MTDQEQELREQIAKQLYENEFSAGYWDTRMTVGDKVRWLAIADRILSLIKEKYKGYVKLDEDQSLPSSGEVVLLDREPFESGYHLGQLRMLETKFRKVKLEGK